MSYTDVQPQQPRTPPGASLPFTLNYVSKPGLGALSIKNFLLNAITLWIYSFWGKTNVRRHIWSCVRVMDEPLEYTGTGLELFLGMLIVTGVVIVPLFLLQTVLQVVYGPEVAAVAQLVALVIILFLLGVAVYRARRYRLSRTVWRGIRGTLTGSPWAYAWSNFWMLLILPFTLMWSWPWMRMRLTSRMTNEMEFGSAPFQFGGPAGPLYKRFAILWFGGLALVILLPTLVWLSGMSAMLQGMMADQSMPSQEEVIGVVVLAIIVIFPLFALVMAVSRAIYIAGEMNHFARCTAFENVRFDMNATTLSLIGLAVGNFFILVLSLGIAAPFVQQRLVRYFCTRLIPVGAVDVATIQQSQAAVDRRGEGLAEVFDIDAF